MSDPLHEHRLQVRFAHDDDVVQTLAPGAADEPLARRIHERSRDSGLQDSNASATGNSIERSAKLVVVVSNHALRSLAERCQLAQLLRRPCLSRCSGDTNVNHLFRVHVDHEEREQRPVPECTQST